MKKIASMLLGLSLAFGSAAAFAQPPAQTDQPKAEKSKKKVDAKSEKAKNIAPPEKSAKNEDQSSKGKGKGKAKGKSEKKKAEEPKAQ